MPKQNAIIINRSHIVRLKILPSKIRGFQDNLRTSEVDIRGGGGGGEGWLFLVNTFGEPVVKGECYPVWKLYMPIVKTSLCKMIAMLCRK